jgi:5-methylcytosine-specific restriction protein A
VRLYNRRAWRSGARAFLMLHPLCVDCRRPATQVDHIVAHQGDERLFWDSRNWQALCRSCHAKKGHSER